MGKTSIEWTDASWNPIVGCTEVSPGCANCYAARLAATRLKSTPAYAGLAEMHCVDISESYKARWTGEVRFLPERLEEPLHWREPRRIFVCDMGDLFHDDVHGDWIDQVLAIIDKCPQHTFQILTKRARRMHDFLRHYPAKPNVWLGTSVENQHFADERIPLLLDTPAAIRWLSCEPLLGPLDLDSEQKDGLHALGCGNTSHKCLPMCRGIDWIVAGGESGPGARPMQPDWARSLRDQCQAAGVPFFFKQWGAWAPCQLNCGNAHAHESIDQTDRGSVVACVGKKAAGRLLDGREWNEFPSPVLTGADNKDGGVRDDQRA